MTIGFNITNPLVAQGTSVPINVTGLPGSATITASVDDGSLFTTSVSRQTVTVTCQVNATLGKSCTLTVVPSTGGSVETTLIAAPASAYNNKDLLIYGLDGKTYLMVNPQGTFVPLTATPGVITPAVLAQAVPVAQVNPTNPPSFIACYVLNENNLAGWMPGNDDCDDVSADESGSEKDDKSG